VSLFQFEHRKAPLLPRDEFVGRLLRNAAIGAALILISLGVGMAGYHAFVHTDWTDSFLNASMILTGMGEITPLDTTAGKIFAGLYALFSGVAFLTIIGVLVAPVVHRFMHRFHLALDEDAVTEAARKAGP
jgi:disulfide bond formation protein DsbB